MNGSLKHDTKQLLGGGLALTLCNGVLVKVEEEGLQTRNGSSCEQQLEVLRKDLSMEGNAKYYCFSNSGDVELMDSVF